MFDNPLAWSDRIKEIRDNMIFNLGHGGEAAGKYILDRVLTHQEKRMQDHDNADTKTED